MMNNLLLKERGTYIRMEFRKSYHIHLIYYQYIKISNQHTYQTEVVAADKELNSRLFAPLVAPFTNMF